MGVVSFWMTPPHPIHEAQGFSDGDENDQSKSYDLAITVIRSQPN